MRDWNLGPGDPLFLTLAADFRLGRTDYANDQIWELETSGGDPPALALTTTFGLRARLMRLFPRFIVGERHICDPSDFALPPRLWAGYPNFLHLTFSPLVDLEVAIEYWIPFSQAVAGRITLLNRAESSLALTLEQCGLLKPLDGRPLEPAMIQMVNVLTGCTGGLVPVLFLTGGPSAGHGPYPSLTLELSLEPGVKRTFTWALAALPEEAASFEAARRVVARPWEAERARIELLHTSQSVEIQTGDPDWDAALAFSQKAAFGLILGAEGGLPYPSFVLSRCPDQGFSSRPDGSDQSLAWRGQSPLEAYYLASLLPGAPAVAMGLLKNFFTLQMEDGFVDGRPGLAGQRGRYLATPLLASLAWMVYQATEDLSFLAEIFPRLQAFYQRWFAPQQDRDGDSFPEWDHLAQTGFEDNPGFSLWSAYGQGTAISCLEDPALGAMLYREGHLLAQMAELLGHPAEREPLELLAVTIRQEVEECWDSAGACYRRRDFASHQSPAGKQIRQYRGDGRFELKQVFDPPVRLLVSLRLKSKTIRRPEIILHGKRKRGALREVLRRADFQWGGDRAVAVTRNLFAALTGLEVRGLHAADRLEIAVMDCRLEDQTLLLPLWAGLPHPQRAQALIQQTLMDAERFGRPFGMPALSSAPRWWGRRSRDPSADALANAVSPLWNHLVGEGLLAYGWREEAVRLLARVMSAVIESLKRKRSFFQWYHAETGVGYGERNHLAGLAPVGFFLDTLGVRFITPLKISLCGKNPFPWPVVVQYRGTRVARGIDETVITFANGQSMTLKDPTNAVIVAE